MFLTAVLASAVTSGLWPALFACLISILTYNFFFLPPLYTFTISDPDNHVALFFFKIVAVIASHLTAWTRTEAVTARQRAKTTEDLYLFARKLATAVTLDDLLWATAFQIASMLTANVVWLLPEDGTIAVRAAYPPEDILDEADLAAAKWCWQHDRPAGRGADTLPGAKRLFLPMHTGRGPVGVVGFDNERPGAFSALISISCSVRLPTRQRWPSNGSISPGTRAGPGGGRNGAAALGIADLDFARSAHAACLHSGLRDKPEELSSNAQ